MILSWFTCFVQSVNLKLFWFAELEEQIQVHNLCKTHKSSKNELSNFDFIEEIMYLSRILNLYLIVFGQYLRKLVMMKYKVP